MLSFTGNLQSTIAPPRHSTSAQRPEDGLRFGAERTAETGEALKQYLAPTIILGGFARPAMPIVFGLLAVIGAGPWLPVTLLFGE